MKNILVSALITLAAATGFATVTVHTDATAFSAAISASGSDNFSDMLCNDMVLSPVARTAGAFSYQISAEEGFYNVCSATGTSLSTNFANTPIKFDLFAPTTTAFAAEFFASDIDGNVIENGEVQVLITDATGAQHQQSVITTTSAVFMGFTSDQGIASIEVLAVSPSGEFYWTTVNGVSVGTALR